MSYSAIPHINFRGGEAREALEFYQGVFGGDTVTHTYAEFGMPADQPDASLLAFGQVATTDGFVIMAYDVPGQQASAPPATARTRREHGVTLTDEQMFVSLRAADLPEAEQIWERLGAGGTVVEPLKQSNWSPGFGMVTDRFGVTWLVNVHEAS